jgi:aminopeptidase N
LGATASSDDPRRDYDVGKLELDLVIDPAEGLISGQVWFRASALVGGLDELVLDAQRDLQIEGVWLDPDGGSLDRGQPLVWEHHPPLLHCRLGSPLASGATAGLTVAFRCRPRARDEFTGFHWRATPSGEHWVASSCQAIGSSSWWPGKDSRFHPADKPDRVSVAVTAPRGLMAVSNGRLRSRRLVALESRTNDSASPVDPSAASLAWERFEWDHPYPLPSYAVSVALAPYQVVERGLPAPGGKAEVPFAYYVLSEDLEKARLQFRQVPELLDVFSSAFGPWPFPESKLGIVQVPFLGMEHSTAIAYGSTFPDWLRAQGLPDPLAVRNRGFDYILVHELAHEWWGNSVTAADWGDFWLHEGFATYAESIWVESRHGREAADRFFFELERHVPRKGSLHRGHGVDGAEGYSSLLYSKGAWVLHTLRHDLAHDETWWKTLRAFQGRYRHSCATTDDFRATLERESGRSWKRFFEQWFLGEGFPCLSGSVSAMARGVRVDVENRPSAGTAFDVPLDIAWEESGRLCQRRIIVPTGRTRLDIECGVAPESLRVVHLERVLGKHEVSTHP